MKTLLILTAALCLQASLSAKSPNFIFILADDQAWNGTSVTMIPGNESSRGAIFHTPNLDRLAAQGMTFSQAYAAHCKCECSRAAIQMGRTTTSLNCPDKMSRNWSAPVSDSLANTLKRANPAYRAAHLGKWQWFQTPASMGYDVSDGITMNEDGDSNDPNDPKQSFSMTRRAKEFMAAQVKDEHPFYLQLSYYAVHPQAQALAATALKYQAINNGKGRGDRGVMAAMTEDLDTCVGEILKTLDTLHLADNTYVIYTSDNGGHTGYLKGGKGDLGDGGLRVPLLVRGPGIIGGTYCNAPAISYDLTATLLDFIKPDSVPPKGSEGGSWKSVLLNQGVGKIQRPIDRFVWHQAVEIDHPQSAIRKGDRKLLYYWDTREAQLYDLAKDPRESRNLAVERPDLVDSLQQELKDHVHAGLGEAAYADLQSGKVQPRNRPKNGKRKPPTGPATGVTEDNESRLPATR